ncbi:MAG: EAL domain-containing protein, partial [Actinomycetota bacterium]
AMYAAKRSGSRVHLFEYASDEARLGRLLLSSEAGAALESEQIKPWFQPKVDLTTGAIVGAEALVRWHHPERGVLLPAEFLDIVELSKHRKALCQTVIEHGIDLLARTAAVHRPVDVAVNVSIRDLLDPAFPAMVGDRLADSGVAPDRLTVEVTERDLMEDNTGFRRAAEAIEATGVTLSIDDFGTGHSSLIRLHQLPVRELKIDRSFVTQLGTDPEAEIIVRSIIELGASLGQRVVAEGIEDEAEAERLLQFGCRFGQGYLYSPAIPADEFLALLEREAPVGEAPGLTR